jgi:hypothetical protein
MNENEIHAHIEQASRDCDGLYTSDHIITLDDGQDECAFFAYVVGLYASPYAIDLDMTVKSVKLDDGDIRMTVSEPTEEGYRETEITFCHDDCETGKSSFRDHTAEAMGY